ncbi:hypothetical protein UMZ34_16590 [Halopseudomonas pachastrellae]|nr:hypothetical protein UMZ34_16590 [Halopseudomonas pachastrellae]
MTAATTSNPEFWRPVKLNREQAMSIIELRRALLKSAEKYQLNGYIVAGREELRQLVDCGAISQREHDDLEMEYSRLFSARLLDFVPLRTPIPVTPAANEPVAAEPTPRAESHGAQLLLSLAPCPLDWWPVSTLKNGWARC